MWRRRWWWRSRHGVMGGRVVLRLPHSESADHCAAVPAFLRTRLGEGGAVRRFESRAHTAGMAQPFRYEWRRVLAYGTIFLVADDRSVVPP